MSRSIIPLDPKPIDVDTLAPLVAELVEWLGPGEWPPTLVGLVRAAPAGLLADTLAELRDVRAVPMRWTLNTIARHALVPLAGLSLVADQPMPPAHGTALIDVLADPRLGAAQRREIETVLIESEDFEGVLEDEARGV